MLTLDYRISLATAPEVSSRFPLSHHWDEEEPRLLVCEAKLLPHQGKNKSSMAIPEPSSGMSWSRRASSSTMTMFAASSSDKKDKVSQNNAVYFPSN